MPSITGLTAVWSGSDADASWDTATWPAGVDPADKIYQVQALDDGTVLSNSGTTSTSLSIGGLDNAKGYTIRVRAVVGSIATPELVGPWATVFLAAAVTPITTPEFVSIEAQQGAAGYNHTFTLPAGVVEDDYVLVLAFVAPHEFVESGTSLASAPADWDAANLTAAQQVFTTWDLPWQGVALMRKMPATPPASAVMTTPVFSDVLFHVRRIRYPTGAQLLNDVRIDTDDGTFATFTQTDDELRMEFNPHTGAARIASLFGSFILPAGRTLINPPSAVPFASNYTIDGTTFKAFSFIQPQPVPDTPPPLVYPFSPGIEYEGILRYPYMNGFAG